MNEGKTETKNNISEEIELLDLYRVIFNQKWLVIKLSLIFCIISMFIALYPVDKYTSKAILAPTQESDGLNSTLRGFSGIANLAGINLPSSSGSNMTEEAIEILSSYGFFRDGIFPNIFLPDLIAIKSWDSKTNSITYKRRLYNSELKKWVRDVDFPLSTTPSAQEAYKVFQKENYRLSRDPDTGFISIAIIHHSPSIAKEWLSIIIFSINNQLRQDQKRRALLSIEYLNNQIEQTSYTEIKQGLFSLMQQETEKLMLIEANEDYVFKVIEPPIVPEEKSGPNRALILIVGSLVGFIFAIFIILAKNFWFDESNRR